MSTVTVIGFWSGVAVLIVLALAFLLPPLLRGSPRRPGPGSREVNAALYRSRLEEFQREVDDGTLEPADLEQAKAELEREILDTVDADVSADAPARPPRAVAVCVAALVPALAVGIYLALGSPGAIDSEPAGPAGGPLASADGATDRAALKRMTDAFAQRLAESPDEGEGWLMLGRSYVMLDEYDKAVEAFANANALLGDTPEVLVDYAEAEALANGNRFSPESKARIEKALEFAPRNEKALWLGAFAAAQHGEVDTAVTHWQTLLEQETEPARRQIIEGLIARVTGTTQSPPAVVTARPGAGPGVNVRVVLEKSLRDSLSGSETVYVFARDAEGAGVPLAVHRTRVNALPATITLDDSMSMVPSLKVSDRDRVMVTARVSMSGDARAASGDLQGSAGPIEVGNDSPVEISIDERVP